MIELVGQYSGALVAMFICFGGGLVAYGKFTGKVVTKKDCKENRGSCNINICNKMDEVKELVKEMDQKRENAKDKQAEELKKIANFMGRTEQFMIDIKNGNK